MLKTTSGRSAPAQTAQNEIHVVATQDQANAWWFLGSLYQVTCASKVKSSAVWSFEVAKIRVKHKQKNTQDFNKQTDKQHGMCNKLSRCGEEIIQVQCVDEKHAWICSLDENFLGWGCVKVPIKQLQNIELSKYALSCVGAASSRRKRPRPQTYVQTTNTHKVNTIICLLESLIYVFDYLFCEFTDENFTAVSSSRIIA